VVIHVRLYPKHMIKKIILTLQLAIVYSLASAQIATPRQLFPGLFEAVQLSDIFPDSKTFVDADPTRNPELIIKDYNRQKDKPGFNLKHFVADNFVIPAPPGNSFKTDISAGIRKHIDTLWQILSRKGDTAPKYSSLLPLPYNFIIPGGRFREIYYWDSYFTMLGLQESHKTQLIRGLVNNFAYLIDKYGFIPNGTRTYYLTRSQPPFFALMVDLLAKDDGNAVLTKYQPELIKEYKFWMRGAGSLQSGQAAFNTVKMPGGEILNRYWDELNLPREESFKKDVEDAKLTMQAPGDFYRNIRAAAESGWDFSTRWFDESGNLASIRTTDIVPVDLNCLLYHLELTIARSYQLQGNYRGYLQYNAKASARKKAILKYCWDNNKGWFMDYDWKLNHTTPNLTLAGVFPLEFGIATPQEADKETAVLKAKFLKPGGLVTTLNRSGQQWDSPNAWAPLQYMAVKGLINYHKKALATAIAKSWIKTNISVFNATGKLMEKYNVVNTHTKAGGGEYPLQDGFGWTNGVLLNLLDNY
jgi:alpha,alpha-trehalase